MGSTITVRPQQTTKYTAICRAKPGCISCFAEVWKITVNTPAAPVITPSATVVCPTDAVTLTATNCAGIVHWTIEGNNEPHTGLTWTGNIGQTTTFRAACEQNNCPGNPSPAISVRVALPTVPTVSVSRSEICGGQPVQLTASSCLGRVRWNDGQEGMVRLVTPYQTTSYRAVCQIGSCQSDSTQTVQVAVRSAILPLNLLTTLTNGCPFQTADLTNAIVNPTGQYTHYAFRSGPLLNSPAVQSPGAVGAGTYYIFGRDTAGCYTEPVAVTVAQQPCQNPVPICLSNPPTVAIRCDSLDWQKGVIHLTALLGGSAHEPVWQCGGGGLFTDASVQARYLLSEADRQRGFALFTLSIPDPDGAGPCVSASVQQRMEAPARELIGLSKKVSEPVWTVDGLTRFVELTYQLTAANLGRHELTRIRLFDDLAVAFLSMGAQIRSVAVRADSGLVVNPAYTGRGADTTLISGGTIPASESAHIWLTVRLDVSQASILRFTNKATVQAVDINGTVCRDNSTNGSEVDPDQNGDPADNDEPTLITLHSLRPEEGETVFIPEGFSPNGDGINDRFVIQRVPIGVTVQLDVYNRWGHLVYQHPNYQNDWDGIPNQGIKLADAKQGLPDGTYYYQIRLSDGREFVRFLTLAR
ncbi:hypothetical protein GCM10027190_52280 [Spirosoma areae]